MRKAFTLVELSIVLIVIGLLSGAILKGQDIIKSAKMKRIISDYSSISTAIYTYEDRFGQFPGDDASSSIGQGFEIRGNEDGRIDKRESTIVFKHLRMAGILTGDANNGKMSHSLGGNIEVIHSSFKGIETLSATTVCFENLNAKDAQLIDTQNDDGKFDSGEIQAKESYSKAKTISMCIQI